MWNPFAGASNVKGAATWSSAEFQTALQKQPAPTATWEDLDRMLRSTEPPEERQRFDDVKRGRGPANHKANVRLFDAPEGYTPQVTLYRDTAGWCPYCQKVWLQLEEKRIPYRIEKVPMSCYGDKPASFLQLNPSGGIPVATIKGKTLSESNDIMAALEREFPDHTPLLPPSDSPAAGRVTPLLRLERRAFSSWFSWLTSSAGAPAAAEMDAVLKQVDAELKAGGGPYFLGAEVSLVDCMFAPFLERMAASLPYYKGFEVRSARYPHLLKWYEAMDTRPTYRGIKSDYYTHCCDLPPQIGRCASLPEAAKFKADIDGGSWSVAVAARDCVEPMLPADTREARRDAARNCINNHAAVVPFAMRAIGDTGRPVRAPLANPYATPGDASYQPAVDFALRVAVHALLRQDAADAVPPTLSAADRDLLALLPKTEVAQCLAYLRDRVGCPRDMTVHGARQFRAHLNWVIDQL